MGLEQQFGPAFTPDLKQAWISLYEGVQSEMIRAAHKPTCRWLPGRARWQVCRLLYSCSRGTGHLLVMDAPRAA
jgi:hypothetical protein